MMKQPVLATDFVVLLDGYTNFDHQPIRHRYPHVSMTMTNLFVVVIKRKHRHHQLRELIVRVQMIVDDHCHLHC